ncbi:MAG: hypothetical protein RL514_2459 [Verrucomicrobiota bacterium]
MSVGSQVTLFVVPTRFALPTDGSLEPFNYQWFKNGTIPVVSSTNRLEFANAQPSDSGVYHVVVSDALGSATSSSATLTVAVPPTITQQFAGTKVVAPNTVRLAPVVSGTEPLRYQWRRDGVEIPEQTNASLTLSNPIRFHSGSYSVVVSNISGSVTSSPAPLRVLVPQRLAMPQRLPDGRLRLTFCDMDGGFFAEAGNANFEVQLSTNLFSTTWVRFTNGFRPRNFFSVN